MTHRNVLGLLGNAFSCCKHCFIIDEIFKDDNIVNLLHADSENFYITIRWKSGRFLEKDNVFLRFHNYLNKVKFERDLQTIKDHYPNFDSEKRDPRQQFRSHLRHLSTSGIVEFLDDLHINETSYRFYRVLRICELAHKHVIDTFQLEMLPPAT